ncbi:MAG TPA: AmmeMemoRadiSam system protein B, partial [bacterium]|nr:AmmeMemoRadiSam system protein B [bacterium]
MQKRISYLAGSWYPKKSESCENAIKDYQKKSKIINDKNLFYKIGIVPHAGWLYSGVLAHSVIYNISRYANPDIIFLAGGHLSFYDNFYFMAECEVETPFGALRCIDDYHNDLTKNLKYKIEEADDYEPDNTTELQLPFLKYYFPNAKIVIVRIPPNETALIFS